MARSIRCGPSQGEAKKQRLSRWGIGAPCRSNVSQLRCQSLRPVLPILPMHPKLSPSGNRGRRKSRQMSPPWRLVIRFRAESASQRKCRVIVSTPACRRFCGLPIWGATCRRQNDCTTDDCTYTPVSTPIPNGERLPRNVDWESLS